MSVSIRLRREGSLNNPYYKVVVADQRSPRDGKFIEIIGRYNPQTDPSIIEFNEERTKHWLSHGAQPSDRYRCPVPSSKYSGITGIFSRSMYSQTFSSVQCRSG